MRKLWQHQRLQLEEVCGMKINVSNSEQKKAVGMVALTVGLCVCSYRDEFDVPHLHVDDPAMPTTVAAIYAPATNTASAIPLSMTWVEEHYK
jgi:hypothetical protein